jgi:WD40 repeat protein
VYRFDRVLIDPTPEALGQTAHLASKAANDGFRARLLTWPFEGFDEFLLSWRAAPTGERQWTGPGKHRKNGPGGDARSAAAVAWWTDPVGRKHFRVAADRVNCGTPSEQSLFNPGQASVYEGERRPALWCVYPDDLYLRQQGSDWPLWAACRCGASGAPEALGWMGPWCAACHDRAEEGAPLTRPGDCPPVVFTGHEHGVADVVFVLGGELLLTRERYGKTIRIWDVSTGQMITRPFQGPQDTGRGLAVSVDGRTAAVCVDNAVFVWSLEDVVVVRTIRLPLTHPSPNVALAFSPDGKSLAWATAGATSNGGFGLHRLSEEEPRWSEVIPHGSGYGDVGIAFSPDGRTVVLGRRNDPTRLLAADDGRPLPISLGERPGPAVAFSPDGKTLLTASDDVTPDSLRAFDVASGRLVASHIGPVAGLAFSPDGKTLAAVGCDGRLRLFDAATWKLIATFRWHQSGLRGVAFSPDGRWLATCGQETRVKLWPVEALLGQERPGRRSSARG